MPRPIAYNDRVLIVGKTGSGKTVLARHLFTGMAGARRTAIDQKGRLELGVAPARDPQELDLAAPVSHYVPAQLTDAEYEQVYRILFAAGGPRVIWTDEAFGPSKAGWAPQGMRLIQQQGRELGIGHIACSQRPVNIEATLRSEAEHIIIFVPAPHRMDLERLAIEVGCTADELRELLEELKRELGDHSHLWYCRETSELVRCAPLPAAWAREPGPRRAAAQEPAPAPS